MTTGDQDRSETRAVHLLVSGVVQGVGFRYFINIRADEAGVAGYARNLENGDVEIWAEGSRAGVARVVDAARQGPRWSRVENVDVRDVEPTGSFRGFGIRH